VTKGRAAFRGSQEHSQRVAYFGDASRGMTGLFNNPNLAIDNSTVNWATGTGQDIVNDLNSLLVKVWIDSANTHLPNAIAIDSARYATISSRRMDTGTDTTILEFFKKNNLYTTTTGQEIRIFPRLQLKGAGVGGKDRMLAYELNDDNLGMCNPIPWRAIAPQMKNLSIVVPAEYKISGVEFRFPFSAAYRDHL
ncbi:MAG: major capsid family protein, partial [Shewanella sp.]